MHWMAQGYILPLKLIPHLLFLKISLSLLFPESHVSLFPHWLKFRFQYTSIVAMKHQSSVEKVTRNWFILISTV